MTTVSTAATDAAFFENRKYTTKLERVRKYRTSGAANRVQSRQTISVQRSWTATSNPGAGAGQGRGDGVQGCVGGVVGFAEVGQDHVLEVGMGDVTQQMPGIRVGEVPQPALDTLFQWPGIRPVDQHAGIVIGFQNQRPASFQVLCDHRSHHTQIGCKAEFNPVRLNGESGRVFRIVRQGKRVDMKVVDLKHGAAVEGGDAWSRPIRFAAPAVLRLR